MVWFPPRGYFLKSTKIILVASEPNIVRAYLSFWGKGITIIPGSRFLKGYIGDNAPQAK